MSRRSNQVNNKSGISKNISIQGRDFGKRVAGSCWIAGNCGFRLLKRSKLSSPVRFLMRLGGKVAKALHFGRQHSPRVSSSGRPRPFVAPAVDSQRNEAIEDCIKFINSASSSSSLPRSNSVSANPS